MVQPVKYATPGFDSGHDLGVMGPNATSGSVLKAESGWDSLSLSQSPSLPVSPSLKYIDKIFF